MCVGGGGEMNTSSEVTGGGGGGENGQHKRQRGSQWRRVRALALENQS